MEHKILGTAEVAEMVGVTEATLRQWRSKGTGPLSYKLGAKIAYDHADVIEWIEYRKEQTMKGGN